MEINAKRKANRAQGIERRAWSWGDENSHIVALDFYPIFIPLFERKVSGVSVQDMLLRLPFLTPETKFSEQNGVKS